MTAKNNKQLPESKYIEWVKGNKSCVIFDNFLYIHAKSGVTIFSTKR